jgi:dihydropyrimidinase
VSDYSPWEGWQVEGRPVMTILRGKVIVEDGKLMADLGYGQLVPRRIDPLYLRRPATSEETAEASQ